MISDLLTVLLGLALTVLTAVFVAAEFALVALDPAQLETDPTASPRAQARLRRAISHLGTALFGTQVGITATTILLGFTTQPALARLLGRLFGLVGWLGAATATGLAAALALVLVNGLSMVAGELAPKNLALTEPLRTARWVTPLVLVFTALARPFVAVLRGSANLVLRLARTTPAEQLSGARTAVELAALVRRSAEQGTLDQALAERLTGSLSLGQLRAIDVMTDRTAVVMVERTDTAAEVVAAAGASGHSTFPVSQGSKDDVVGLVRLRRAIAVPYERRADVPVSALMDAALRVPETAGLGPVLVELRSAGVPMAIVVDEYGGTSGVLTVEDVAEEIVGEVADEHDLAGPPLVRRLPDGSWRVPGRLRPDELFEQTGIRLPEHAAYETLGGLVMQLLERIPQTGDEVVSAGARLLVESMTGRRVETLRVRPGEPGQAGPISGPMLPGGGGEES